MRIKGQVVFEEPVLIQNAQLAWFILHIQHWTDRLQDLHNSSITLRDFGGALRIQKLWASVPSSLAIYWRVSCVRYCDLGCKAQSVSEF